LGLSRRFWEAATNPTLDIAWVFIPPYPKSAFPGVPQAKAEHPSKNNCSIFALNSQQSLAVTPIGKRFACHTLSGMDSQPREDKIGQGVIPLFAAAALFWTGVISLLAWWLR